MSISVAEEWSDLRIKIPISTFEGEASPFISLRGRRGDETIQADAATFSYVSGSPFIIPLVEAGRVKIIPDEVSADTESTIRATVGSQSVDATFTVVNKAEPEPSRGVTIAQCSFYNDSQGREGFVGSGFFSFDTRTVNNIYTSSPYGYSVLSTTRKLVATSIGSGLPSYAQDGSVYITD